ncbi:tetratricopeptide repeat protein [Microscilla marina]|uniref:Putative ggdef family protein n=1 Tax=Microscilla marina ATCC 23134 TaxID=313606 RepID=A1ZIX8_MICM2|nr:tetratricopeptide repeat protein [Microscilla marina]EAY29514.1 putative ggdef family protein [Microscilla marina ATCC 23134]
MKIHEDTRPQKKQCLFIAFFCWICFPLLVTSSSAQTPQIDQWKAALNTKTTDSMRLHLLDKICYAYHKRSPDSIRFFSQKALSIAQKLQSKLAIAKIKNHFGASYFFQAKYKEAEKYYQESLNLFKEISHKLGTSVAYNNLANIYKQQGAYTKAIFYYQRGLSIQEKANNLRLMSVSYTNIATIYRFQKNYQKALEYNKKAVDLKKAINSQRGVAIVYTNIGMVHGEMKQYSLALEYLQKALTISQQLKLKNPLVFNNLSYIYSKLNQLDSAFFYAQKGLRMSIDIDDIKGKTISKINLAHIYFARQKYTYAIKNGEEALTLAQQNKRLISIKNISEVLFKCYMKLGSYKKAIESRTLLIQAKDSLFNLEKNKQLVEIETRYETQKKEQQIILKNNQITLLKKEKQHETLLKYTFVGAFISLFFLGSLLVMFLRLRVSKNKQLIIQNQQLHDAETKLTKAQLNEKKLLAETLKKELEIKQQQLASKALHIIQKNEILEKVKESIQSLKKDNKVNVTQLARLVDSGIQIDKDWNNFFALFLEVHQGFFDKLKGISDELSDTELRLCALVKLKFTSKEIASILGITHGSTSVARHRIRKKLSIPSDEKLAKFIDDL